jgi:hypothetical protein
MEPHFVVEPMEAVVVDDGSARITSDQVHELAPDATPGTRLLVVGIAGSSMKGALRAALERLMLMEVEAKPAHRSLRGALAGSATVSWDDFERASRAAVDEAEHREPDAW